MALRYLGKTCTSLVQRSTWGTTAAAPWSRTLSHYPINDTMFGMDEERQKLREIAFNFFQKELAPHANEIDKLDNFK